LFLTFSFSSLAEARVVSYYQNLSFASAKAEAFYFNQKGGEMKLATLGPQGTFSHQAALDYHPQAEIIFKKTIYDVMQAVEDKEAELGIVPLENSVAGTMGVTLDALMDFDLKIKAEEIVPVRHYLAVAQKNYQEIKRIYTHPQSYAQCEKFIQKNYPQAEIIETSSNGKSAEMLAQRRQADEAAIVPLLAAQIYQLKVIKENIQDNPFNVTRFIVLSSQDATKPTGYDRTSIAIYPQIDRPGLLHDLLEEFAKRQINLSKIESRPAKGKLGDYIFFVDFQGHIAENKVKEALEALEKSAFVKVFGSYPRKY
jgi:prephenate dehydratase